MRGGARLKVRVEMTGRATIVIPEGRLDFSAAANFQAQGCPPSLAAGSVLTEMVTGLTIEEALALKPRDVTQALETLPRNKEHCAILAIDALKAAMISSPK